MSKPAQQVAQFGQVNPSSLRRGTILWIADFTDGDGVWKKVEVKENLAPNADKVKVIVPGTNEEVQVSVKDPMFLSNADVWSNSEGLIGVQDLASLMHLHEPEVLETLQLRFDVDQIYTFCGGILIAVNPFKGIKGLYEPTTLTKVVEAELRGDSVPHIFTIASRTLNNLNRYRESQVVLISGESGAGKTETTKHVLKFLSETMGGASESGGASPRRVSKIKTESVSTEQKILNSNPLLEAFGNACTVRNNNSSRFGKFIEMRFQETKGTASFVGACIDTYLLEKVRVTEVTENKPKAPAKGQQPKTPKQERSYHIFYQVCAAAKKLGQDAFGLPMNWFDDADKYNYLNKSPLRTLPGCDDANEFSETVKAMQTLGMSPENMAAIIKIVAAVLNLGNVEVEGDGESSKVKQGNKYFESVAQLLKIDRKVLQRALTFRFIQVSKTEKYDKPLRQKEAEDAREALARALYGALFLYIVEQVNISLAGVDMSNTQSYIGVLDIFGFESFETNSFEQLCINFTNERLQQFFNQFVFKLEEQLYEREGIPWDPLDFPDNQDSVDLLQQKATGVFAMLDEECMVPNGSDANFCSKLIRQHTQTKKHKRFEEIKVKPTWFTIKHFAGPVSYCTDSFMDKNKDQLSHDLVEAMAGSSDGFVAGLFKNSAKYESILAPKDQDAGAARGKRKIYTVSAEFKDQLSSLMDIVDTTEPHFVRCIKPNPQNLPDLYDRKAVTEQLRYGGVLQVVQVSRAGYPVRINHQECWDDYKILASPNIVSGLKHIDDPKVRAQKLLDHLQTELNIPKQANTGAQGWNVGKTLVFFKQSAYERVKFARLEMLIKSTTLIQACWRRRTAAKLYKAIRLFTRHVQAMIRGKQARMDFVRRQRERAVMQMQALARMYAARKAYKNVVKKVTRLQAWRRGITGRRRAANYKLITAATRIQRFWRMTQEKQIYIALKKTILLAQQRWRVHASKAQFRKLKQEAKEVGALMAKTQKAHEQATEARKRNEELEAQQLQLQSQKKDLSTKVTSLEDKVVKMQETIDQLTKENEEAAKTVNDPTKMVVDSEAMEAMQKKLEEKESEVSSLQAELNALKESFAEKEEALKQAETRYQQLLKSTAMQSMSTLPAGSNQQRPTARIGGAPRSSNRNVDIQLIGAPGVGKTSLLEHLIRENDPAQLEKFQEQKANLMSHHMTQIEDKMIKILDCSGNTRAQHLVKEWFGRSHFVFIVYDLSQPKTLEQAMEMIKDVSAAGARVVLFGNKWSIDQGKQVAVSVAEAKDMAARHEAMAIESSNLLDGVRIYMNSYDEEGPDGTGSAGLEQSPDGNKRSSIASAIDSVKNWFTPQQDRAGGRAAGAGVLRPSLKGTKAMKQASRSGGDLNQELRPVQELQDSESAVTCICFGQERLHKAYVLLATASKDGTVVIYRCYRTEMEVSMLSDQDFPAEDEALAGTPPDHSNIAVHSRLVGHSRAITSIFFNLLEDQLVTTSIDKSVRFWGVDNGEMLKVFTDSSPVPVAAFLPFNPQVFVAANSNAVLRLVNVQNGMVLQKLKVETEVRALRFDDTGLFLLAGTKNGSIHVLEASDSSTLKFKFKVQLARGGVTCITFVPAAYGQPPCLLVNTSDSSATIIDCTYGPPAGVLTNLAVRHRVRIAHSLLPLKCCYSPSGQGYLISGSEDKEVYIYSLAKGQNYKIQFLKHHQVPVVAVAVNLQDTLLASADSLGRIVLWRRMDFSHLPD
mmetsp:Transcript_70275/g.168404  ORF Transcript_70275/g.168404 Transcript_70275/m.168404 type:complete len:1729 (+) Transcript_70275:106-5292(+)